MASKDAVLEIESRVVDTLVRVDGKRMRQVYSINSSFTVRENIF